MKILHIASEYPPAKVYGLGRFVHGLARAQAAQGDEVHVLTNSHGGQEDDVVKEGVHLHRIAAPNPPRPSDPHGEVLQWNHAVVARLFDRLQVFRDVDVIVAHDWLAAPAAREAARILGRPLVVVIHDEVVGKHAGVLDREGRFVRELECLVVHDSNLVIANSEYIAQQVVKHYGVAAERVVAIHGGIDPAFDRSTPTDHQADFRAALAAEDELLVVYVGRLDPEKGLGVLSDAIPLVHDHESRVKFVLVGTGRREDALRARLGARARLLGYARGEALVRLYRAADMVVVPSVYEPFGLVALEAMLCGASVVVAGSGGLPEIVRHGQDGLVVPPGDAQALARAILTLGADPAARRVFSLAGRRRALEAFDWEVIARRTREAYAGVLGASPAICTEPPARPPRPSVSAIVITRQAPACAEATTRTLLERVEGLSEAVLLDHGSEDAAMKRVERLGQELRAEGWSARVVRADPHFSREAALLLALEDTASERVFVVSDEVEALLGEEGLLDGLLWLLDEARAATVSPSLVPRAQAALPASATGLPEQKRLEELPPAGFLARRRELASALALGEGSLGARLRRTSGGEHWEHPRRLVHARGEARRDGRSPFSAAPSTPLPVSIVLVAYGRVELSGECIDSILAHTPPPFELVLVNNGSRDATLTLFRSVRARLGPATPVQVLDNGANLGFPKGANLGVRAARGRHVIVLNNDTRVLPGWLEALLAAAETSVDVGVVTAKILDLDGTTVQSAGGVVHAPEGGFWSPGQGEERTSPSVSRRRTVTNAGGPCMLLTRALMERLAPDGEIFDESYSPGYFEDSDLCMRAREAGFALVYEPGAEVLHHGKATASLVASEGSLDVWGRFDLNRRRFHERWARRLEEDARAERERVRREQTPSASGPARIGTVQR
ncbi:MAG: glycosyltransferase [Planctomycetota bacterium]|nr:glycosyltransferase [Planctomycetota bacterium]